MKNIAIAIFISILTVAFFGCHRSSNGHGADSQPGPASQQDSISNVVYSPLTYIVKDSVAVDITGVDSLIMYSLFRNNEMKSLFSVAKGGNIVCLSDSILCLDNQDMAMFTFADYSQTDQIFYILFNCNKQEFIQSERINLPYLGMRINDANLLCIDSITADSIYISGKGIDFTAEALSLDCDSNRIINYYEYQ